jgi:hypothetical protein
MAQAPIVRVQQAFQNIIQTGMNPKTFREMWISRNKEQPKREWNQIEQAKTQPVNSLEGCAEQPNVNLQREHRKEMV